MGGAGYMYEQLPCIGVCKFMCVCVLCTQEECALVGVLRKSARNEFI